MDRVRINDTWSVTGMRATGSNDCTIEDVFVSHDFVFPWVDAAPRFETGTFGRIPLLIQFGPGLAATAVGAARGAQQRFIELATAKRPVGAITTLAERAYGQMAAGEAEGLILAAEDTLAAAAAEAWRRGERGRAVRQGHACRVPHAPRDRGAARRPRDRPSPRRGGHERDRRAVAARARVARRPCGVSTHPSRTSGASRSQVAHSSASTPVSSSDRPTLGRVRFVPALLVVLLGACAGADASIPDVASGGRLGAGQRR